MNPSGYADLRRLLTASRLPKDLRLRLLNASVISTLLYGCEAGKLSAQARGKLNGTVSKMLSRITGRTIADEARKPTLDVVMRARDRRWNWLGHFLRLEEHRVIRQVLMNCVKPTPDSIFGDPDLDSRKAAELAADREKWKILRPSKRCKPLHGDMQ